MNQGFLDAMSLVHVGVGMGFRLFRVRWWLTLLVAVAWEFAEHALKARHPKMFVYPSQDTLINSIGDVLCAMAGWLVAGRISRASGPRPGPRTAP
jgi:hypothetical protein